MLRFFAILFCSHLWSFPLFSCVFTEKNCVRPLFYAVGNNADVSQLQSVNVKQVKVAAYLISGVLAAATGVMTTIDINSAQPSTGGNWEFKAVVACVVGGASLTGGVGN